MKQPVSVSNVNTYGGAQAQQVGMQSRAGNQPQFGGQSQMGGSQYTGQSQYGKQPQNNMSQSGYTNR